MASIRKRGKSYQITVSNGRDIHDKQILETGKGTAGALKQIILPSAKGTQHRYTDSIE